VAQIAGEPLIELMSIFQGKNAIATYIQEVVLII
jgi:hypothetical protein